MAAGLLRRLCRHVTVPGTEHRAPVPGIAIHRSVRELAVRQQGQLPPQTATEETVLDLADVGASFDDVVSLLARACLPRKGRPKRS
jgi:hypothetical protein